MSEQDKKPIEGASAGSEDLKSSIETLQKQLSEKDAQLKKATEEKDAAKMSLLDPKYIAFLESQRENKTEKIDDLKGELEKGDKSNEEVKQLKKTITELSQQVRQVSAVLELNSVEKKYSDFDDYRQDIVKLLESSPTELTIEQAYKIAKGAKLEAKTEEDKKKEADSGSEKPGARPVEGEKPKEYKSPEEASDAAWEKTVGKGKTTL